MSIERGVELRDLVQDAAGVTAHVHRGDQDIEPIRARYVVGCDGAQSAVRELLGLTFGGGMGMFPQLFMLGDVDVEWSMPEGHLLRFVQLVDDELRGMLVRFQALADSLKELCAGQLNAYVLLSPEAPLPARLGLPVLRDADDQFRVAYGVTGASAYLIRPDGHVGFRSSPVEATALHKHLGGVFTTSPSRTLARVHEVTEGATCHDARHA